MTTTPRAFGRELDANETRIGSDSPKMTMTPARARERGDEESIVVEANDDE